MKKTTQQGFTLPELLIALLIFALISSAGVYCLQLGVQARTQLDEADKRIRAVELMRAILKEDLSLVTQRRVRDEFGTQAPAAIIGGRGFDYRPPIDGETPLLGFVRNNWSNPGGEAPRASLQYVEYLVIEDSLIRRARPYLDHARNQPAIERVVIEGISNVRIDFFEQETNSGLQWSLLWPIPTSQGFAPLAVRIQYTTERFGELEQLFWIGEIAG